VVRDGRSVANSLIQMAWWYGYLGTSNWKFGELPDKYQQEWDAAGNSFPVLAGIEWKMMMDAFDGTKHIVPPANCMELRYEDMVEQPRQSTKRLLDFVGLEWTRGFESNFSRHSFGANKAGYLKDLSAKDVAQLEESLAHHLRQRGYEVAQGSQQIGEALGSRESNVSQVEMPVLSA
jgi:hypothetical protein